MFYLVSSGKENDTQKNKPSSSDNFSDVPIEICKFFENSRELSDMRGFLIKYSLTKNPLVPPKARGVKLGWYSKYGNENL